MHKDEALANVKRMNMIIAHLTTLMPRLTDEHRQHMAACIAAAEVVKGDLQNVALDAHFKTVLTKVHSS